MEAQSSQGMYFTMDMLKEILNESRQQTIEAIKELKKPSPEEQEALDDKKKKTQESRVRRVREAVQDERVKRQTQFLCQHIKHAEGVYKQEHAFRGQVNNDNCCRPQCIRCNKLFPPFKVSEEQLKSGMSLQNVKNLTAEALLHAHMRSFPDCKDCSLGACAVRDLRELKQGRLDPEPEILPNGKIKAELLTA